MLQADVAAMYTAMLIGWVVIIIIFYVIAILIAVWVYKDAQKRNMDNPTLWLIIVCLLGCCGLIIYLVVRNKK